MAIPKEPRQLMINIMYLVLTALLALNVSAEIFNAFKQVDKGLVKSNASIDKSNSSLPQLITDGAKKKESLAQYAERIEPARAASSELSNYLNDIIEHMKKETGGFKTEKDGTLTDELKGKKDFDITTRYLVGEPEAPGKGAELKQKLLDYKTAMLALVDTADQMDFAGKISVNVDDEIWKKKGKPSWEYFNFSHMPLQATIPILRKFQNDVKSTESEFLNYLANKVGTNVDVVLDKFTVVSAPEKSYVIKGEKFKTDVFLSAFAGSDSKTGISVSVNGQRMPVNNDGIARFEQSASSVGLKKYNATASITNPVTGETQTFKKEFSYEVGERGVSVSADKMNVFYVGVPNPVSVTAAGVPSNQVKVSMTGGGGTITGGNGKYTVNVTQPTPNGQFAYINVAGPGLNEKREFRVKPIPDPTAKLGGKTGGGMQAGTFKAQLGVGAFLDNFDFDARCRIKGYQLYYVPKRQDPVPALNAGAKYGADAGRLVGKAKPGDTYYFMDVKATCPGDKIPREINSLVFNIR